MIARLTLVLVFAFASSAMADFTVNEIDGRSLPFPGYSVPQSVLSPTQDSTYFIAPGAGTPAAFQLAGGPFTDSIFDGQSELIGPDLSGNGLIVSSDSLTQNSPTNFDLVFRIATTVGGNILPTGVIGDSGVAFVSVGIFVGGGLNPVDLDAPLLANTAIIEVFDTANQSIGTINVLESGNFTAGIGGGWDGSLGLNFGNQIPIGDVGAIELQINYDTKAVPEPSTTFIMLTTLVGSAVYRRRR